MNPTEAAYAQKLDLMRKAGVIRSWEFEQRPIQLEDTAHVKRPITFTPDFYVVTADGAGEYHEVKGGHMKEDAWIKLRWFCERFSRTPVVLAQLVKGKWYIEDPRQRGRLKKRTPTIRTGKGKEARNA